VQTQKDISKQGVASLTEGEEASKSNKQEIEGKIEAKPSLLALLPLLAVLLSTISTS
jgi:hypothetical protein